MATTANMSRIYSIAIAAGYIAIINFVSGCGGGDVEPSGKNAIEAASAEKHPPHKRALAFDASGRAIEIYDAMYYRSKPNPDALHASGFKRVYVWPHEGLGSNTEPYWEYQNNDAAPTHELSGVDEIRIRSIADILCNLIHQSEQTHIVFDIEWPGIGVPGNHTASAAQLAQEALNRRNLGKVAAWASNQFRNGSCASRVKFGLYGIPIDWPGARHSESMKAHYHQINSDFRNALAGKIDFTAPVLYLRYHPSHGTNPTGGEDFFLFWENTVKFFADSAKDWGLPIIPFISTRWHTGQTNPGPTLISESIFKETLGVLANPEHGFSGFFLWDCGCFGTGLGDGSEAWNISSGWFPAIVKQFGLGGPTIKYNGNEITTSINWLNQTTNTTTGSGNFSLENDGEIGGAILSGMSISASSPWVVYENLCGNQLTPNGSCTFKLRFTPSEARPYAGLLTISLADGWKRVINISGTGIPPPSLDASTGFSVASTPADVPSTFKWQANNASSAAVHCTGAGISLSSAALDGTLNLSPASVGQVDCTITAANSVGNQVGGSYNMTVTAPSPALKISYAGLVNPPTINWLSQTVGTAVGSGHFTLSNQSVTTAAGVSITGPTPWEIYDNGCGSTLSGNGGSCTFRIKFSPTQAKYYAGQLAVKTTNGSAPNVNLLGVGISIPAISDGTGFSVASTHVGTPTTFNWQVANATTASVNCSGAGISLSSAALNGTFNIYPPTTGHVSCSVTSKNSVGTQVTSNYSLAVSAPTAVLTTSYAGLISPPTINWLSQVVGTTTGSAQFKLTNPTATDAVGIRMTASDPWQVYDNNCGSMLAGNGGFCTFRIKFTPSQANSYTGLLEISAANGSTPSISLIGVGIN